MWSLLLGAIPERWPPRTRASGNLMTLGAYLEEVFRGRQQRLRELTPVCCGVPAPLDAPVVELWRHLAHPDHFLYVALVSDDLLLPATDGGKRGTDADPESDAFSSPLAPRVSLMDEETPVAGEIGMEAPRASMDGTGQSSAPESPAVTPGEGNLRSSPQQGVGAAMNERSASAAGEAERANESSPDMQESPQPEAPDATRRVGGSGGGDGGAPPADTG